MKKRGIVAVIVLFLIGLDQLVKSYIRPADSTG